MGKRRKKTPRSRKVSDARAQPAESGKVSGAHAQPAESGLLPPALALALPYQLVVPGIEKIWITTRGRRNQFLAAPARKSGWVPPPPPPGDDDEVIEILTSSKNHPMRLWAPVQPEPPLEDDPEWPKGYDAREAFEHAKEAGYSPEQMEELEHQHLEILDFVRWRRQQREQSATRRKIQFRPGRKVDLLGNLIDAIMPAIAQTTPKLSDAFNAVRAALVTRARQGDKLLKSVDMTHVHWIDVRKKARKSSWEAIRKRVREWLEDHDFLEVDGAENRGANKNATKGGRNDDEAAAGTVPAQ